MLVARCLVLSAIVFAGCHTAEKVAVTSFHVIDAPAKYVRDHVDHHDTTAATANVSDVSTPGRPVSSPPPKTAQPQTTTEHPKTASTQATPRPSPAPTKSTTASSGSTAQFPTAKPVPGKPGYVYSIDPAGGIVDVTGYKSGDKAKDPYTKQIFVVP